MSYNRIVVSNDYYYRIMMDAISQGSGWIAFDTETTGLHLKADKPFLLTISITNYSFAIDLLQWSKEDVQKVVDPMLSLTCICFQTSVLLIHTIM
jgi:hypothetical protein